MTFQSRPLGKSRRNNSRIDQRFSVAPLVASARRDARITGVKMAFIVVVDRARGPPPKSQERAEN